MISFVLTEEQSQVGSELQAIVSSLNGDVPVSQVETLSNWIREAVAGTRSTASLFAIFAAIIAERILGIVPFTQVIG